MTEALFTHYVVCEKCRRQLRVDSLDIAVTCCKFVWFSGGPTTMRYRTISHSLARTLKVWFGAGKITHRRRSHSRITK